MYIPLYFSSKVHTFSSTQTQGFAHDPILLHLSLTNEYIPVKITAFEYNSNTGNKIYSIEAVDIENEKSAGQLEDGNINSPHSPIADFNAKVKKLLEDANNTSKVVDENGEPLVVYHGTQWDPYAEKIGDGVFKSGWFTGLRNRAEGFGSPVQVFLNIKNPVYTSEIEGEFPALPEGFDLNNPDTWGEYDGFISYIDYPEEPVISEFGKRRIRMKNPDNYEEALAEALAKAPRGRQLFSIIPRYPNQIKSADPVTYDDNGNVIPLSERFNKNNDDIRFRKVNDKFMSEARKDGIPAIIGREQYDDVMRKAFESADGNIRKKITEMASKNGWDM